MGRCKERIEFPEFAECNKEMCCFECEEDKTICPFMSECIPVVKDLGVLPESCIKYEQGEDEE